MCVREKTKWKWEKKKKKRKEVRRHLGHLWIKRKKFFFWKQRRENEAKSSHALNGLRFRRHLLLLLRFVIFKKRTVILLHREREREEIEGNENIWIKMRKREREKVTAWIEIESWRARYGLVHRRHTTPFFGFLFSWPVFFILVAAAITL